MNENDPTVQRIHDRIDNVAKDVHTLQLTTVKRDGPIVDEVRRMARLVDRLSDKLLTKDDFRSAMEADDYRTFNRNDRIIGSILALMMLLMQGVSVLVLIYH